MSAPTDAFECAVVIGTRGRGAKIVPLLRSLQDSDLAEFEAVVVDQSDDDGTERAVEPFLSDQRFTYLRSAQTGVSTARNIGVARTSAPVIVITDDDCIVRPDWLSTMIAPFAQDERLGVMFCDVEPAAHPPGVAGHTPQIAFGTTRTLASVDEAWRHARNGFCLGAGMAMRRRTFEEVDGFDEQIGPGRRFGSAEDNDLSWRALIAGWTVRHDAGIAVIHDGFRNLDDFRELVNRDFYGAGATLSKYVRRGRWGAVALTVTWLWRYGLADPARQVLAGDRPNGFRRPLKLMHGLIDGMRARVDRPSFKFDVAP